MDRTNGAIVSSGVTRRYLLYVPRSYDPSKPSPLLISIHPAATWPAVEQSISRWNDLAEQRGFTVVYPAGSGAFFDGFSRGPHVWPMEPHSLARDVKFISDLIDKVETEYNVDPRRIYADGMSNGGGTAFALACKLSDRIAAVGLVAAAQPLPWDRCGNSKPVPVIVFHGTADKFAPYHGGSSPIAPGVFPDMPDWTAHAAQRNRCKGDPTDAPITASVRRLAYANCADNADVIFYTVAGAGHTWPGGKHLAEWIAGTTTDDINATSLMWDFFAQHPLKSK